MRYLVMFRTLTRRDVTHERDENLNEDRPAGPAAGLNAYPSKHICRRALTLQ